MSKRSEKTEPPPFEKFEDLTKRLLAVSKKDLDKEIAKNKRKAANTRARNLRVRNVKPPVKS